jgi:hypothetical protein
MTEIVLPTTGNCMRPWIWTDGRLHVEQCGMDQLRLGDIAVWFDGAHFVAHRVVELGPGVLATRADSRLTVDPRVQPCQLLGRAVRFTKGPISYRLDGPLVALLMRVGRVPWAKLMAAGRWGRGRILQR